MNPAPNLQFFAQWLSIAAMAGILASCSTKNTSANTPPVGFYRGQYYLSDSEKKLSAQQLHLRIQDEAYLAAEQRLREIKKTILGTAAGIGLGTAFGGHVEVNPHIESPVAQAKLKIQAYSDRLVELGEKPVSAEAQITAAIEARKKKKR